MSSVRRLSFENLESRRLLATDLEIVSVDFTNAIGELTGTTPIEGEKVYARVHYRITDLTGADAYNISWDMDGITTKQFNFFGFPGANVDLFWFHGGWIAQPGASHTITVTVDSDNTVAESNETNNSITLSPFTPTAVSSSLPAKFAIPIAGTQNVDWVLHDYVDVNPKSFFDDPVDFFEDYQGNTTTTRDFHNGLDFSIPNFAAQDMGVEVRAAAAGTVIEVRNGFFDRETQLSFGDPGNYVFIDHGNDWVTQYYHFREDSIAVSVNDVVSAGDLLGFVGSAGNSTGPHVHFEIQHDKTPVDPFVAPGDYFLSPPPYVFDASLPNNLIDFAVTNTIYDGNDIFVGPPAEHAREKVSAIEEFPTTGHTVIAYAQFTSVEAGDTWEAQLFRPDNSLFADFEHFTFLEDRPINGGWYNPGVTNSMTGTWRVDFLFNGAKVGEQTFTVGSAEPEIRVFDTTLSEEVYLIDGRTTAIEFGSADFDTDNDIDGGDFFAWQRSFGTFFDASRADGDATKNGGVNGDDLELWVAEFGQSEPTKTFRVENHGYGDLTTSSVLLPAGYSIVESLDSTIAAGASETFTVKLDSGPVGAKTGTIQINTNDGDEGAFAFAVEGEVNTLLAAASTPARILPFNEALWQGFEKEGDELILWGETPARVFVDQVGQGGSPLVIYLTSLHSPTESETQEQPTESADAQLVDELFRALGVTGNLN